MEKLQAVKRIYADDGTKNKNETNKKNHKKKQNNNKKHEKISKNNANLANILRILKNNAVAASFIVVVFLLTIILTMFCFNGEYYSFLSRPKLLQHSGLVRCLMCIFLSLQLICYFLSIFSPVFSKANPPQDVSQTNPPQDVSTNALSVSKFKKSQFSNFFRRSQNQIVILLLSLLLLLLMFNLEMLSICVILTFFMTFFVFMIFLRQKKPVLKIFLAISILTLICLWLAFYFIYLLN